MGDGVRIGGRVVAGEGPELTSADPTTGEPVWVGRSASADQVVEAVTAAREPGRAWARRSVADRRAVLDRFGQGLEARRDELRDAISAETGKPRWEADTEVAAMIAKIGHSNRAYDERTGLIELDLDGAIRSVTRHRPHGVVAVFGPYNFPGHLPNGHLVPALLAGNAAVFKPSEHTPWVADVTARIWSDAGLPAGVLSVVPGGPDVGRALAAQPVDAILFTGSAATGRSLHEQLAGRPETLLALEMGGNNPLIVREVDDLDGAVHVAVMSAFLSAGQRCTCARRLVVPDSSWGSRFIERLVAVAADLVVGPPDAEPEPFCGPVIDRVTAERLLDVQTRLIGLGGEPLLESELRPHAFLTPAVIDVTGVDAVPDEEWFGPLLQVWRVGSLDAAIDRANHTSFGLSAGIVTDEVDEWDRFRAESRAGVVNWNRPLTGASSAAPFGGTGRSGNHRPSARYAADYCAYPVASLEARHAARPDEPPPGLRFATDEP